MCANRYFPFEKEIGGLSVNGAFPEFYLMSRPYAKGRFRIAEYSLGFLGLPIGDIRGRSL
jgi:hypothetical protein